MTIWGKVSRPRVSGRAGFALLAVIWGVGLVAILVVAFMTSGRLRLQMALNVASADAAGYVADAAINLTTLTLLSKQNPAAAPLDDHDGETAAPRFCRFEEAAVAVAVEDEGGKIDLNAAPLETLRALLRGVGLAESAASEVALSIAAYRTAQLPAGPGAISRPTAQQSDKGLPLKQAPFETVLELDQVPGIDAALYRLLLRLVTVKSRSPGLDPRAAPPGLFAALAGYPVEDVRRLIATPFPNALDRKDARFPANLTQNSEHSIYLIHVEVLLPAGQTAARDALIDLRPVNGKPFVVNEIRRGDAIYAERLRAMISANANGLPKC